MIIMAASLMFVGVIVVSLSMKRHYVQMRPLQMRFPSSRILLYRSTGYACLGIAFAICSAKMGIGVGIVFWLGLLTVAAFAQSLLLTYRPVWVLRLGTGAVVLAVVVLSL